MVQKHDGFTSFPSAQDQKAPWKASFRTWNALYFVFYLLVRSNSGSIYLYLLIISSQISGPLHHEPAKKSGLGSGLMPRALKTVFFFALLVHYI